MINNLQTYSKIPHTWDNKTQKLVVRDYVYLGLVLFSLAVLCNVAIDKTYSYIASNIDSWREETADQVYAQEVEKTSISIVEETPVQEIIVKEVEKTDFRVEKLREFLEDKESPLAPYSEYIVEQSDINGIDWTIIVAISKIESNFCKNTITASNNCWGLGGSNFMYFDTFEDAISFEARLLNKHYRKGTNEAIKNKYCPASDGCNSSWADIVTDTTSELLTYKN